MSGYRHSKLFSGKKIPYAAYKEIMSNSETQDAIIHVLKALFELYKVDIDEMMEFLEIKPLFATVSLRCKWVYFVKSVVKLAYNHQEKPVEYHGIRL